MSSSDRGVALLEALVAVAVLASAGIAVLTLLAADAGAIRRAASAEAEFKAADRVLTAATLMTRHELEDRLGRRRVGEFTLLIQRREELFRVAVESADSLAEPLLETLVYRP